MAVEIQVRRGAASVWTSVNPTLGQGEFGLETDTDNLKIGNGTSAWTSLAYFSSGGGGGGSVSSVFGRTGAIAASVSDYSAYYVPIATGSSVTAITVPTNPTATDTSQQPANDAFVWNALIAASTTTDVIDFGSGAPASVVGQNGDGYIDSNTFNVWGPKSGGTWPGSPLGTLAITNSPTLTGTPTAPTNATATDTSTAIATDAFVWNAISAATAAASVINFGSGSPASVTGQIGDGYIDSVSLNVWGPKTGATWSSTPLGTYAVASVSASVTTVNTNTVILCSSGTFPVALGTTNMPFGKYQLVKNQGSGTITVSSATGSVDLTSVGAHAAAGYLFDGTNWNCIHTFNGTTT